MASQQPKHIHNSIHPQMLLFSRRIQQSVVYGLKIGYTADYSRTIYTEHSSILTSSWMNLSVSNEGNMFPVRQYTIISGNMLIPSTFTAAFDFVRKWKRPSANTAADGLSHWKMARNSRLER